MASEPSETTTSPAETVKTVLASLPVIVTETVAVVAVVNVIAPVEVPQRVTPPVPLPST